MKYSFPLTPAFFVYPALLLPSWLTYPRWPFSFFIHNSKAGNLTDLKLPPFSILNPNLLPQKRTQAPHFCGYFFSSFVIWLQGQKNQFGGNRMEAEAFMLNVCAVILAPHVMMWNAANVEKRRANMNVMCPQQEMGHRKSTLLQLETHIVNALVVYANGSQLLTQKRSLALIYPFSLMLSLLFWPE